jgi:predicted TIM-barrel fold metal-dependent hydrolase
LINEVHATGLANTDGLVANDAKKLDAPSVLTQGSRFADTMLALHVVWDKRGNRKPPTDIGIVDPHIHAMSNKPDGLDSLAKWMERNHVERTIVSPLDGSRAITEDERKIMFANFEKYRGKIDRFCLIKPDEVKTVEEAVAILEKEKAEGAVAFGEHYGDNMMFDDPRNMRLYAACEKVGLPVMFHIDTNKNMDEPGLPRVEHVLKTYPNCKLIAHAQWWLHLVEGACDRQLREHPNLYADISGTQMAAMLNRDRNYTREFLIRHQDRILFGSDAGWWSFNNDEATESQFSVLEELDLPKEVRRKIYRENAIRLFGLKP